MNKTIKIFFLLIFGLSLFSCGSEVSSFDAASTATGGGGTNSPVDNPTPDPTPPANYNLTHFFVALDTSTTYPHYMSRLNSYGSQCSIAPTSTGNDISCVVEVPELSLYFGGLNFAVNVPAGMCEYVARKPYWFYNKEIGTGPAAVQLEETTNSTGTVSTRCSVNGSALTSVCSNFSEVIFNREADNTLTPECVYGTECCLGTYDLTTTTIDASGTTTATTEEREWGGNIASCIGGAGKTDWDSTNNEGYPKSILSEMRTGDLFSYSVTAPVTAIDGASSNISIANYYTVTSPAVSSPHYHTGFGALSGSTSVFPYYIDPISDRSGDKVERGSPFYEYTCLNDALEIKNRIRVYVREWDDYTKYSSYVATGVVSGTPWDVTPGSQEGSPDCGGLSPDLCNDFRDADNFVFELPGSIYNTTASGSATRGTYFPSNEYK